MATNAAIPNPQSPISKQVWDWMIQEFQKRTPGNKPLAKMEHWEGGHFMGSFKTTVHLLRNRRCICLCSLGAGWHYPFNHGG